MLKSEVIGNLGADAHVVTGNFQNFVSMNVAHTRKFRKADGTQYEETIWVNVVVNWDCSKLMPFLLKGTKVFVSGNTRLRTFTAKGGVVAAGIDIIADTIELCGSKQPSTTSPVPTDSQQAKQQAPQQYVDTSTGEVITDDMFSNPPF